MGPWIGPVVTINWKTFFPTQMKGGFGNCLAGEALSAAGTEVLLKGAEKGLSAAGAKAAAGKIPGISALVLTWDVFYGVPHCALDSVQSVPNPDFKPQ